MPLSPGDKLGPYEILAPIGAGGMGEVYKGRDTRLDRLVAIKTSQTGFGVRFEREARAIASLNHPHICQLYDVGPDYLVMEYIEGAPLVSKEKPGPLALDQSLKYAAQICEALDAAHRKGITHRDLKPANILVTKGGIKLLDFGLAKFAQEPKPVGDATVTMALTGKNEIVGTLYYMSPEQLQAQADGRELDARSDIFSFGLVLYEMLTGKRAMEGASPASVIAAIMERPAPSVADVAPAALDWVLKRCLAKDPDERWQTARDLKAELERIANSSGRNSSTEVIAGVTPSPPRALRKLDWKAGIAVALGLASVAGWYFAIQSPRDQPAPARLSIALPPGQEITSYPAITRDGKTIAYVAQQGADTPQLYLRDLNSFESRVVAGSSGAVQPFFSPDGKWVAYFAQGQLQKAEVSGGAPIKLAEAAYPFGGTWNDDNTIIYAPSLDSGLLRIPASGGTPESLTKPDSAAKGYAHVFPQTLPGGRSLLFNIWGQTQGNAVLSLDSKRWDLVLPMGAFTFGIFDATRGSTGRLLVVDQSAGIMAAPFDAAHPARTTADTTVLTGVYFDIENETRGWLAISNNRTAVYAPGNPAKATLVWVDREGNVEAVARDQAMYREASLSPDASRAIVRHGLEFWIHDLQRGTQTPLTSQSSSLNAVWSPDGKRIVFGSNRGGEWDLYSQPADGSGPAEVLLKRPNDQFPNSFSPVGTLLFREVTPQTGVDLWTLSPDGKTSPFRVTPFNETHGEFSPDGKWVAYTSDESGRNEIYVQRYAAGANHGGANRIPVSSGGATSPRWSRDGKELFYVTGDAVVAVAFRPDGSFGAPARLFDRSNFRFSPKYNTYDVSPDGKRFLMIRRDEGSVPRQLNVILNWSGEAERLAPNGNK